MKLSNLIPSADLLEKLEGLEDGLMQRRKLGRLGKTGAAFAFLTLLSNVAPLLPSGMNNWILNLPSPWKELTIVGLVLALGMIFLAILYSLWLKESRRPIRYTCSLGHFSPVLSDDYNTPATPIKDELNWLHHDIAQHLNQRVGRLMFLFSPKAGLSTQPADQESARGEQPSTDQHIHIAGVYRLQDKSLGKSMDEPPHPDWELVVMPRVRIGRADSPEKLAKPVHHQLGPDTTLSEEKYKDLVEHVYFNIVSEVYQQIRQDVERKISLLPTRRHKAVAYYHEAEDYARSNTWRAYEEAGQLYLEASRLFEPFNPLVNPLPKSSFLRLWRTLDTAVDGLAKNTCRLLHLFRPTMALHNVIAARAKLGYANMLLFRSLLTQLLGYRPLPTYEAPPFAKQALDAATSLPYDVTRLPDDTFSRKRCLFDAHVTSAVSCSTLGEHDKSRDHLDQAKSIDPLRATTSAIYLYAESLSPAEPQKKYDWLVSAVEQDPSFEIAQFSKAFEREMRWRRGPSPTSAHLEAGLVIKEYRAVLKLNPSNIGAGANAAFVLWALAEENETLRSKKRDEAKAFLDRALEYKKLAPETVVVEHNYDLARIYAEEGDFEKAYAYLVKAEDGRRAHRSTHNVYPDSYFYAYIGDDLRRRYNTYRKTVLGRISDSDEDRPIAQKVVCAFVLDEYGQACWSQYLMVRDERLKRLAIAAFNKSIAMYDQGIMSRYHLANALGGHERSHLLDEVISRDKGWDWARLERAVNDANGALRKAHTAETMERVASELSKKAAKLKELADKLEKCINKTGRTEKCASIENEISQLLMQEPGAGAPFTMMLPTTLPELARQRATEWMSLVKSNRNKASDLRKEVEPIKRDVQDKARFLLPHKWLWLPRSNTTPEFNKQCINDSRFQAEAKWERELDSIQVGALYQWTSMLLPPFSEATTLGRNLLSRIQETFSPADLELLARSHTLATQEEQAKLKRKCGRIVDALLKGPCSWSLLEWFDYLDLKLPPDVLKKLSHSAREHGAVLHRVLEPLAFEAMQNGDEQFKNPSDSGKAAATYRAVLDLNIGGTPARLAAGKLAVLLLADNRLKEAEPLLEQSLPETYSLLPSAVKEPDGEVEKFLNKNELARIEMKLGYERRLRSTTVRSATDAVMGLLRVRSSEESRSTEYNNVRTPLEVEWDEALLPWDVDDFLTNQAAPWVRQRLEERYGVRVPGIRFRALPEGERSGLFRILDHEVVVEENIASGQVPVTAPHTEESWQEPLWFTMERLEAYLEGHLAQWIRVQEVQNLLERNCQDLYNASIPDSIPEFETHDHIGPLTIVIRSLVAERVPIREFSGIYKLYRSLWESGEHVQAITRTIRMDRAIKPELWGNTSEYRRFMLSKSAEGELRDACESIDGFTALVLSPERRMEVVSAIAAGMGQDGKNSLTIRSSTLRPLVRRLIESKLPHVPVLAEEELECQVRANEFVEITVPPAEGRERAKT